MDYRYQGIIISKHDIAEVDRIYTIYTLEAGKIRAIGKGTRSPISKLAGNLETGTYAEVRIARTRGLGKITSAITLDNFLSLKSSYPALQKVFHSLRILDRMAAEQEKDERVFQLLLEYLKAMDKLSVVQDKKKMDVVTFGFIFKLLDFMGYKFDMSRCVKCHAKLVPNGNYFSASHGGVLCQKCRPDGEKRISISSGAIKLVRIFLSNNISSLIKIEASDADIKNLNTVSDEAVGWIVG